MKWFLRILAMIAVLGIAVVAAAAMLDTETRPAPDENPGYRTSEIEVPHRDVTLPVHIWYPAKADGTPALIGQNALFYGHYVHPDASPEAGPFPVVLISHGSGGNAVQLGWIARELALSGMIVVATNHPGTTSRDSDPFQTIKIWERPADLTALLDWTLAQPDLPADPAKVGVLGFSLGGHSALALSGARASKDKFVSYCASPIEGALDCDWMEAAGVDFTTIDAAAYEADLSDPRIGATVAIDPALPLATTPESLAAIAHPVLIANLGEQDSVPRAAPGTSASSQSAQPWDGSSSGSQALRTSATSPQASTGATFTKA